MEMLLKQLKSECELLLETAKNYTDETEIFKKIAVDCVDNMQELVILITKAAEEELNLDGVFAQGELNYVKKDVIEEPIISKEVEKRNATET